MDDEKLLKWFQLFKLFNHPNYSEQFDTSFEITFDLRDYDVEAKELQAKGEWEGDGDEADHQEEYSHPAAPSLASQHLARNSLSLHSNGLVGPTFTHRSNNLAAGMNL